MPDQPAHVRRLLDAIDTLDESVAENIERNRAIRHRLASLRKQLTAGRSVADVTDAQQRPLVVELLSSNMATLETAGAEFRAAQAQALRVEGLTIEAIAEHFGVTRQRISALLRQRAAGALRGDNP